MGEINTVTIPLDRYDELLRDSYDLRQANAAIANIRRMVFEEIAKDCRRYGGAYANGDCSSIMCKKLFREIEIYDPSCTPLIREALEEYEAKKAGEEA